MHSRIGARRALRGYQIITQSGPLMQSPAWAVLVIQAMDINKVEEQKRIVERVEALWQMCDALEAGLVAVHEVHGRLAKPGFSLAVSKPNKVGQKLHVNEVG